MTNPSGTQKQYLAKFVQESYRRGDEITKTLETTDYQEILDYGREQDMTSCQVFEVEVVTVGGKEFKSDPVKMGGTLFFNVQNIVTRDEAVSQTETFMDEASPDLKNVFAMLKKAGGQDFEAALEHAVTQDRANLERMSDDTVFVITNKGHQQILQKDDKAFDGSGAQKWPAAAAGNAPQNTAATPHESALDKIARNRFKKPFQGPKRN